MIWIPLFIALAYGLLYSMMPRDDFGFQRAIDPFYFSFTTMSTVGYGDFTPKTVRAKTLVMTQHVMLIVGVITIIKFFIRT